MASFRLILLTGTGAGTEFPLEKTELFIGRDLSNDIVINDPEVSRRHARLVMSGLTFSIEDLGSTNGTFVRGQRLSSAVVLTPGELITMGEKVNLKFDQIQIDPNATVAASRPVVAQHPVTPAAPSAPVYTPPPAAPVYTPPPAAPVYTPPPAAPVYTPPPAAPVYTPPPQQAAPVYTPVQPPAGQYGFVQPPAPAKKKKGWLIALIIILGVILLFCVIPTILIDLTNSWCSWFPGILNSIQPGACP